MPVQKCSPSRDSSGYSVGVQEQGICVGQSQRKLILINHTTRVKSTYRRVRKGHNQNMRMHRPKRKIQYPEIDESNHIAVKHVIEKQVPGEPTRNVCAQCYRKSHLSMKSMFMQDQAMKLVSIPCEKSHTRILYRLKPSALPSTSLYYHTPGPRHKTQSENDTMTTGHPCS